MKANTITKSPERYAKSIFMKDIAASPNIKASRMYSGTIEIIFSLSTSVFPLNYEKIK